MGKDATELAALPLGAWVDRVSKQEARASPPARIWSCVSNYYVKTLAGWQVSSCFKKKEQVVCVRALFNAVLQPAHAGG